MFNKRNKSKLSGLIANLKENLFHFVTKYNVAIYSFI